MLRRDLEGYEVNRVGLFDWYRILGPCFNCGRRTSHRENTGYRMHYCCRRCKGVAEEKRAEEKIAEEMAAEKRAADKRAAKKRAARDKEANSMIIAGIPKMLVNLWVNGSLEKGDMFFMLQTFNVNIKNLENELLNLVEGRDLPGFLTGDLRNKISILGDLFSDYSPDLVKFTFSNNSLFDIHTLEFFQRCATDDNLYHLYNSILEGSIEIKFAQKLIVDYGFNDHPEAVREVINGGNWEAVAVKHGFFQF